MKFVRTDRFNEVITAVNFVCAWDFIRSIPIVSEHERDINNWNLKFNFFQRKYMGQIDGGYDYDLWVKNNYYYENNSAIHLERIS